MATPPRLSHDIGARIRMHRERRGRTQVVTAGLAGITADYLGQVERGRKTPSAGVLRALAAALDVPVGALLGSHPDTSPASAVGGSEPLALALMSAGSTPVDPDELKIRIDHAWSVWQSSGYRYSRLLPELPALIRDTEATRRCARQRLEHRRVAACASELYGLLRTVTRRIGRTDLSFLVADRGMRAAEDADNPLCLAAARWNFGHALLMANDCDAAIEFAEQAAADVLADDSVCSDAPALAGALHLVAVVADARAGRYWSARDRLNDANALARRTDNANNIGHTMFSGLNVALHGMWVELDAGDAAAALRIADRINAVECPSVERRFTFTLDLARTYELRREETGTLLHLLDAERSAPEDLDRDPRARDMLRRLVRSPHSTSRGHAAKLAERLSVDI
ncbi:MAG: helix-turn-helix transcriptional regulator [Nocardia sp.]|nr:helix-turn-helix transcriptional regulator [Nocardia sp.]